MNGQTFRDSNSAIGIFASFLNGGQLLTLKVPIMTAADDSHKYFFIVFQRKYDLMFQVNPLLAEDSHEKSSLTFFKR